MLKKWRWEPSLTRNLGIILLVFIAFGFLIPAIWLLLPQSIPSDVKAPKRRAELVNANRDLALKAFQTLGGLGFIATAFIAWRNLQISEDKQVTERFSKAVDMMADEKKMTVKLGGIYTLERIAKDSPEDSITIMEVLAAYIRENSRIEEGENEYLQKYVSTDIHAALSVIRELTIRVKNYTSLDLSYTNLTGADLRKANFTSANLGNSCLQNTNLTGAILTKANLNNADISAAFLYSVEFTNADLSNANLSHSKFDELSMNNLKTAKSLQGVDLSHVDLSHVDLTGANLESAKLNRTTLIGAKLNGAILYYAKLEDAELENAELNDAKLADAKLSGIKLVGADLTNANLTGADVEKYELGEAVLNNTTLPDGSILNPNHDCPK